MLLMINRDDMYLWQTLGEHSACNILHNLYISHFLITKWKVEKLSMSLGCSQAAHWEIRQFMTLTVVFSNTWLLCSEWEPRKGCLSVLLERLRKDNLTNSCERMSRTLWGFWDEDRTRAQYKQRCADLCTGNIYNPSAIMKQRVELLLCSQGRDIGR